MVKSAVLAGFPAANVRLVPSDERFRMRPEALAATIREDRAKGMRPFLIVGSGGTTNTGAVDDLEALADLAAAEGLWLHVDAAYGGFFALTERGRRRLRGLERADSMILDPHKGLFLPYGTGCLLVRDGAALHRAHSIDADYMPQFQADPDLVDFCEISPELSRDFRGSAGLAAAQDARPGRLPRRPRREARPGANGPAPSSRSSPSVEIVAEPQLSIVAFRLAPGRARPGDDEPAEPRLPGADQRPPAGLPDRHDRAGGRFVLRICVLSFRTHRDRMEACLEDIRAARTEALAETDAGQEAH